MKSKDMSTELLLPLLLKAPETTYFPSFSQFSLFLAYVYIYTYVDDRHKHTAPIM